MTSTQRSTVDDATAIPCLKRIHFLGPIKKLGGPTGLKVLESLRDDPLLGKEVARLLKKRAPRRHSPRDRAEASS